MNVDSHIAYRCVQKLVGNMYNCCQFFMITVVLAQSLTTHITFTHITFVLNETKLVWEIDNVTEHHSVPELDVNSLASSIL